MSFCTFCPSRFIPQLRAKPRAKRSLCEPIRLVYFPPLSNKCHFLLLMVWKESVIKIQTHGVTKHATNSCFLLRPFIVENGSQHSLAIGGYDNKYLQYFADLQCITATARTIFLTNIRKQNKHIYCTVYATAE